MEPLGNYTPELRTLWHKAYEAGIQEAAREGAIINSRILPGKPIVLSSIPYPDFRKGKRT